MGIASRIKTEIGGTWFGHPAEPRDIEEAQTLLHVEFPDWLKEIYLCFNGWRGPTSNLYLSPLLDRHDPMDSVVRFNLYVADDPQSSVKVPSFVLLGVLSSTFEHWGIKLDTGDLIKTTAYEVEAPGYEVLGRDVLRMLKEDQGLQHPGL